MEKVTKEITIGELLRIDDGLIPILLDAGMHCLGCPASQSESIGEAAFVHGIDGDELLDKINEYLADK